MSATKALSGFKPSRIRGSGANSTGTNEYRVSSGYAANIFYGDLVRNVSGFVQVITSITDFTLGVAQGVRYVQDGKPVWSKYWPSGTSASDIFMTVVDDPMATFVVQADASVSVGDLNSQNFDVTLGAGSTFTGNSGFGVKAATRKTTVQSIISHPQIPLLNSVSSVNTVRVASLTSRCDHLPEHHLTTILR
jgi:hypothetical protein